MKVDPDSHYVAYKRNHTSISGLFIERKFNHFYSYVIFIMKSMFICND